MSVVDSVQEHQRFDQVTVQMNGGGWNLLSTQEFTRIPVTERIQLILKGKVKFIRDGQIIPATEALKRN